MTDLDPSGQSRLSRNVVTSWLSHLVFVAFGFIMPRAVSDTIGQEALGIWDFGWTIVSYLGMAMVGIGSSVNRYVAKNRASGEIDRLSEIVSSVVAIQSMIGAGVLAVTVALSFALPQLIAGKLGTHAETAGTVVLFLGAALAVQMGFDSFRGVLTGCHRWTIYNLLNAVGYAIGAMSMLVVLSRGGGLEGMALIFLLVTIATEVVRFFMARQICPEIDLKWKNINSADIAMVFKFGFKNVLIGLPKLIITQTVNVFVLVNLGPAMLAVFARPLALTSHVATLINKFAFVLTPTAGSLQSSGKHLELREFALVTMRAGWIMSILPVTFLFVLGDEVVRLWMGASYSNWAVTAILAVGSLLPMAQNSLLMVMIGMDEHGSIAKLSFVISMLVMVPGLVFVSYSGWTIGAAALLVVLPANAGMAAVTVFMGTKSLKINAKQYCSRVLRDPLIIFATNCVALVLVRLYGPEDLIANLVLGAFTVAALSGLLLRNDLKTVVRNF